MNPIVLIAASSGELEPMLEIVAALPVPCRAAVFVVEHIGSHQSMLPHLLARASGLPALHPRDGAPIETGNIYVAPPDHHMLLELGRIHLSQGPKVHHTRPAADPLFISAAEAYGERVVGIVLSGGGSDAAIGLRVVKAHGGLALVQNPEEARTHFMPRAAIVTANPDAVLSVQEIAQRVRACVRQGMLPSDFHCESRRSGLEGLGNSR
jgi:two-component system chemotaxis response regulator CheB